MTLHILDFETHFDEAVGYTLKKLPVTQYIRDPRFKALGVATASPPGPAMWRPAEAIRNLPPTVWVAHNAAFDAAVAWERYQATPKLWIDTMLLARWHIAQGLLPADLTTGLAVLADYFGLGTKGDTQKAVAEGSEALARYACNDITLTAGLLVRLLPGVPEEELKLMDLHVRMGAEAALGLDRTPLQYEIDSGEGLPPEVRKAVGSAKTFVQLLAARGVVVPSKISPRTGKAAPALAKTDAFMQSLAVHPDPVVRGLQDARLSSKSTIRATRAQRFADIGEPLPVPLQYYAAHTGRSGGLDRMNMQNLPAVRSGSRLRHALVAQPGHTLVVGDSSQIEVRVVAWRAQDDTLLQRLRDKDAGTGPDVYAAFAADVLYHKPWQEVTKAERNAGKPPMLACGFGMGAGGLVEYARAMAVPMDETMARTAVQGYRRTFPGVVRWWDALETEAYNTGKTVLPSGRLLTYPDMHRRGRDVWFKRHQIFSRGRVGMRDDVKLWHGLLVENDTQAVARDVVMWQTLQLPQRWKVVLLVHDEIVLHVPDEEVAQASAALLEALSTPPPWAKGLPLAAEVETGKNYGELR